MASEIQVKIDSRNTIAGMQKGVELYCAGLKATVVEAAKIKTLTEKDFLALIKGAEEAFVEACGEEEAKC